MMNILRLTCSDRVATPRETFNLVRTILGLLLVLAAGLKAHELATSPVSENGLLTSRWFLIGVVEGELFLGAWLLSGVYLWILWPVTLLCFGVFAEVSLYKAVSGAASCGCFGSLAVHPWYTFALDVVIVVALVRWRPRPESVTTPTRSEFRRLLSTLAVAVIIGVPAAGLMAGFTAGGVSENGAVFGNDEIVVLEPEDWVGKPFPLLKHIDVGERLKTGHWTIVLYHHDCSSCQVAIPEYERLARETAGQAGARRIALIQMPPFTKDDLRLPAADSPCLLGRLSDEREWFAATPLEITVKDGITTAAKEHAKPPAFAEPSRL